MNLVNQVTTPLPVALIGAPASYHYQVAQAVYGDTAELNYLPTFAAVLDAVAAGTHQGVIAVSNSTIGTIADNLRQISERAEQIAMVQMYDLPIEHRLITAKNSQIEQIQQVYSHPAALQQCSTWLINNPHITIEERPDTASAIHEVCELNDPTIAAIGSPYAAHYYGGTIHHIPISNQTNNRTTFAIIAPTHSQKDPMQQILQFRQQLNAIDSNIVELLAQRCQISKTIGAFKKQNSLPILDSSREAELIENLMQTALQRQLSPQLVKSIYTVVLEESRNIQATIRTQEAA